MSDSTKFIFILVFVVYIRPGCPNNCNSQGSCEDGECRFVDPCILLLKCVTSYNSQVQYVLCFGLYIVL